MISSQVFKNTESMIYEYFKNKQDIDNLNYKVSVLENKKNKLQYILENTDISSFESLNGDIQGINYEIEKVQTSKNKESYFEKTLLKEVEKIENKYIDINKKIIELKVEIAEKESQVSDMEYIINKLNEEAKFFIDLRYREESSLYTIAMKLHISKSTADRRRRRIIEDIAKLNNNYGTNMEQSWEIMA